MSEVKSRLNTLREAMKKNGIDAFIIPSSDPHQSEYVCDHWKSREYFSGFSGSSGYLVVTEDYAALWTDSRYFIQAEVELKDSGVILHKQSIPHSPEHVEWMSGILGEGSKIGMEGLLFSRGQVEYLEEVFSNNNQELVNVDGILKDVWKDRPVMPESRCYAHDITFTGKSRIEKLGSLREKMALDATNWMFVSSLDEIAYILNIRAWDIEFTPVALAYLLIGNDDCILYINSDRMETSLIDRLEGEGIQLKAYEEAVMDLNSLASNECIYLDRDSVSWTFDKGIKASKIVGESLIIPMQAIKSTIEIEHIKNAMLKDGVALTKFFMWVEKNYQGTQLKEYDLVKKLAFFRAEQPDYVGESFGAIVGFKSNGAIVHYGPDKESSALLEGEGMLLVDSGGQYLDGTTDITRTIYLGEPKEEHKRNFTLVLKGNIALQTIHFPEGTTGMQLDTLARMYLWNEGLNYGHGTGHGVGFFLRVHEPPQGFATSGATSRGTAAHKAGMFTSNEPGFYKEGEYGIRIENLMICKKAEKNDFGQFLNFESLTLFPISISLMEIDLLDEKEIFWINAYHTKVFDRLAPYLNEEEKAWLKNACREI